MPSPLAARRLPSTSRLHALLALLASAPGCAAPEAAGEPGDALFPADRVLDVALDLAPADWEALRLERPPGGDPRLPPCGADTSGFRYRFFPATVTVDGATVASAGVRKKAFCGSYSTVKPALKIKLDEYVPDQELDGLSTLTLNNSIQDPSYLRQCLGYRLLGDAGVPAPRCAFARVKVNGADLGVYVHVETVKKGFLRRHFSGDGGNLYEGGPADFRARMVDRFELETNEAAGDRSDLDAAVQALATDDAGLLAAAEQRFALDGFLSYWAVDVLTLNIDGYAGNMNNFFVYHDPGDDRFHFIPWGIDLSFHDLPAGTPPGEEPWSPDILDRGLLAQRLWALPDGQARLRARLGELLDGPWDAAALTAEIDRLEALVSPLAPAGDTAPRALAVAELRGFVAAREEALRAAHGL